MLNTLCNISIKTVITALFLLLNTSISYANDWNAETHNIILGDFNGDDADDILLQTKNSLYLNALIEGEGNGQFLHTYQNWQETYLDINWNSNASTILTGDFDRDNRTDLLVRSLTDGSHRILLADTEGKFSSVSHILPQNHLGLTWSTNSSNIVVADFNNDNYADVFLQAKNSDQSSSIITADASGNLTDIHQSIASNYLGIDWSQKSHNIIAGDFNGDGFTDLFLQAVSTIVMIPMDDLIIPIQVLPKEGHILLLADDAGQFNNITRQWQNGELSGLDLDSSKYEIHAADFDGDGTSELLLQTVNGGNLHILKFNGVDSFSIVQTWSDTQLGANWNSVNSNLLLGNIDRNNGIDVIVQPKDTSGLAYIAYSTPTGTLQTAVEVNLTTDSHENKNYEVGKVPADFNVTPSGQASYDVPIAIPPGISGMQPELSISYSSQGGNGILGMGWSVNGLSSIHRCAKTLSQDGVVGTVNVDSNDRFCLDGQRLVLINGQYGAPGSTYRTEVDSFSIVTAKGGSITTGPDWFEVETKERQIYEYGNTADSKKTVSTKAGVIAWSANEIRDVKNNAIKYNYYNNLETNESYITNITYTHNTGIGVNALRRIDFKYEANDRPDLIEGYLYGVKQKLSKRLGSISTSINNNVIRNYNFEYKNNAINQFSELEKIYECDVNNNCVLPTSFVWSTVLPGYQANVQSGQSYTDLKLYNTHVMDVNGDGRSDLVYAEGSWKIAFNNAGNCNSAPCEPVWTITDTQITAQVDMSPRVIDYNKDGLPDLQFSDYHDYVLLSIKNSLQKYIIPRENTLITAIAGNNVKTPYIIDMDNDGVGEIITGGYIDRITTDSTKTWGYYKKINGRYVYHSSNLDSYYSRSGAIYYDYSFVIDHDGDGSPEMMFPNIEKGIWEILVIENGQLATIPTNLKTAHYDKFEQADINGDGLQDFLVQENNVVQAYISNGTTQFEGPITTSISTLNFDKAIFVDYNIDGKTDLLKPENGKLVLYQSIGRDYSVITTNMTDEGFSDGAQQGDFDGDGKADLLIPINSNWYVKYQNTNVPNQLEKITDGLNAETSIKFELLNNPLIYTKDEDANCINSYPVICLSGAMRVVSEYTSSNGNNTKAKYSYKYSDLKAHARGRGVLGFATVELFDHQSNIRILNTYDNSTGINFTNKDPLGYPDTYPYVGMHVQSVTTHEASSNNSVIIKKSITESFETINSPGGTAYYPYATKTHVYGYELNGNPVNVVTTENSYDTFGNPDQIIITKTDVSNLPANGEQYITTTTNAYHNPAGDHDLYRRFGRVTLTHVETKRLNAYSPNFTLNASDNIKSRYSAFEYNSDLMMSAEIIEPFQPKYRVRTDYTYDNYGHKNSSNVSAGSNPVIAYSAGDPAVSSETATYTFPTKQTSVTYTNLDSLTPSVTTSFSVSNVTHSETKILDARYGVTTQLIGPNGISVSTYWEYDDFGRKIVEKRADGSQTSINYNWCTLSCPAEGVYSVTMTESGKPPVIAYTDILGREVRTKTLGFNGTYVQKDTEYNTLGKVSRVSTPYFVGESPQWTQYTYDDLGRVTKEQAPDLSINQIDYNGLTITKTNDKLQTVTEIKNVDERIVKVIDHAQNFNQYVYDVSGNLLVTIDAQNNLATMSYDLVNRKIAANDPDMGYWEYQYDAIGKLRWQKDAKGQITTTDYDVLGRMTRRVNVEGTSQWHYDRNKDGSAATGAIGKLVQVDSPNYSRLQRYDNLGRALSVKTTIDGLDYLQTTSYDTTVSYTRVSTTAYPNGFAVKYHYNGAGFLERLTNAITNVEYWKLNYVNARGQTDSESLSNGIITSSRGYNDQTGRLKDITSFTGTQTLQLSSYQFDTLGNLEKRVDSLPVQNNTEVFTYDGLNRLKSATLNSNPAVTYDYDKIGNIIHKSDVSASNYVNGKNNGKTDGSRLLPHTVSSIGAISYNYDANGNMTSGDGRSLTYTSFNKPLRISRGSTANDYFYDADLNRVKKVSTKDGNITTTTYLGKSYERIVKPSNVVEEKYYISVGSSTVIYTKRDNNTSDTRYLLKDHLGSTDIIIDETGTVIESLSFDAWGARRNSNWSATGNFGLNITSSSTRGFTGHEQDDEIGLINMNARLYDAKIGRFLTADTYVQFPYTTQGLNRYTYVNNNPLSFTDPSGHFINSLVGAVRSFFRGVRRFISKNIRTIAALIATYITWGAGSSLAGGNLSFAGTVATGATAGFTGTFVATGSFDAAIKGAVIGGLSAGLLSKVGASEVVLGKEGVALAHGLIGGVRSRLQGGKFGNGFFSALVGKVVTFQMRDGGVFATEDKALKYVIASTSGGLTAKIGGGKFENGAFAAAFGLLFNEYSTERTDKDDHGNTAEYCGSCVMRKINGKWAWIPGETASKLLIKTGSMTEAKAKSALTIISVGAGLTAATGMLIVRGVTAGTKAWQYLSSAATAVDALRDENVTLIEGGRIGVETIGLINMPFQLRIATEFINGAYDAATTIQDLKGQ